MKKDSKIVVLIALVPIESFGIVAPRNPVILDLPIFASATFAMRPNLDQPVVDPRETGNRVRGDSADCRDVSLPVMADDILD